MWTVMLGGSLDLSIMMTSVSTIIAFASVPLWVLLVGPYIIADATFVIPFMDITITVVSLLIPCGLGVALQIFYPKCKKYCNYVVAPISGASILITFTFGMYAYQFIFTLFTWRMLVSGICLPTIGYLAGMSLSFLFRMPVDQVIAISVETGVQNYTIAIIILNMTLESPAGELACTMPGASVIFTPLPLLLLVAVRKVYDRVKAGSLNISTPSHIKEMANTNTTLDQKAEKNGKQHALTPTTAEGGIDNPGADLRDNI
ncbi:hypothetical protein Pmani_039947 [Petrolisthes manimaculis]|uniref:Ileal sodium/bile acid cotransporter n=1 Tax=Petrolisthes manimaculis TaxID=1843537 RepID=A0AAE1TJ31_9EUCA|nr:hypothetical protein Pmani_039947 [Petrolisthes manimaculis]